MTPMEIIKSAAFEQWFSGLRDRLARVRMQARIDRIQLGNFGDAKPVRNGIFEMRIHYGPGYRIYFLREGESTVVLLAGGDKSTQDADIKRAIVIAKQWSN